MHRHSSLVSVHHSVWHTRSPRCASPALLHLPFRTQSSPSSLPPVRLCEHCAVHRTVSVHQAVSQETLRPLTLSRAPKWLGCRPRRDRGFRVVRSSVDPTRRVRWGSRGGPRQPSADSPPWAETWDTCPCTCPCTWVYMDMDMYMCDMYMTCTTCACTWTRTWITYVLIIKRKTCP